MGSTADRTRLHKRPKRGGTGPGFARRQNGIFDVSQGRQPSDPPAGVVNLFKPAGATSAQYVYRLRRVFGIRKVGHAGTLDPFADGVLLGCVGRATKLVERLMNLPKVYRAQFRLGVTNESFDPEQPAEPVVGAVAPDRDTIGSAVGAFEGRIEQIPPVFSAAKVGGVPGYRRTRRGEAIELKARSVLIRRIAVVGYDWPMLSLEIRCGRGVYVRALARDLGRRLGCGAICETLRRESVGPFHVRDAVNLNDVAPDEVRNALMTISNTLERIESYPLK